MRHANKANTGCDEDRLNGWPFLFSAIDEQARC